MPLRHGPLEKPTLILNEQEMREPIPDWLPGRTKDPTQLKLFVRWVCRIHHRAQEIQLARALGYGESPFKSTLAGGVLETACFELSVLIGRSFDIVDFDTRDLTDKLVQLQRLFHVQGEFGVWHTLASSLQQLWIRSQEN